MKKNVIFFCIIFTFLTLFPHTNRLCANSGNKKNAFFQNSNQLLPGKKTTYTFVILAHVRNEKDNELWKRCYDSIREFYPHTSIVIIDDNSNLPISNESLHNAVVIRSEYAGAGELLPYYYFLKHKWTSRIIFLHDSMLLKRAFTQIELDHLIKFHWYFDLCWDNNETINWLLSHLNDSDELIDYNLNHKNLWYGCYGVASIIDLKVLKHIERKYRFTAALKDVIKVRDMRSALERVFAIVLFKEGFLNKENCSNFGNITRDFPYDTVKMDDELLNKLKQNHPGAILKTWHGR